MTIHNLRLNYQRTPLALEDAAPGFSWELRAEREGTAQVAYRIQVLQNGTPVWDTGRVESDETLNIFYAGQPLQPHTVYTWQVTAWDNHGDSVTEESYWRTGYLGTAWQAPYVSSDLSEESLKSPRMRRRFTLKEKPMAAYACVYAPCWFQLRINGTTPDDRQLTPAAAPGEQPIYESYDLTDYLVAGDNVIGIWMGDGYDMRFVRWGWRYTGPKRATVELRLTYADGTTQIIATDEEWRGCDTSAIIENSVYHGELYDARLDEPWDTVAFDDSAWAPVTVLAAPERTMMSRDIPQLRVNQHLEPVNWWRTKEGKLILDYGQNMGGWVRLRLSGEAGQTVSMHFSEEIDRDTRELDPFTNRSARATDTYIFKGEGVEEYQPRFTYHGFRYVEVTGWDGDVLPGYFTACVMHCDFDVVGDFTCDDPSINRLYSNIRWGIRGNAVSYPTDCPMRDERTPCQHDVVVYFDLACRIFDGAQYWRNFGRFTQCTSGNAGWEGAELTIAWHQYTWYGDKRYLELVYPTLKEYTHHTERAFPDLCDRFFGDWCAPKDNADGGYECAFSYVAPTCTALMYYQTMLYGEICKVLGHTEELPWVEKRLAHIYKTYNDTFYNAENGWYDEGEQTAGVLPLYFDMVPEDKKAQILQSVVDGILIRKNNHVDTGIYGTKYLPLVLADNGLLDVALDALFQPTYPSFGFEFSKGATTIWEQFMERGGMSSHNHGMFSGGGTFIFDKLAGFDGFEDACRRMTIKPCLSKRVNTLDCGVGTPRGQYRVAYTRENGRFNMTVTVPVGCTATVYLPDGTEHICNHGKHTLTCMA